MVSRSNGRAANGSKNSALPFIIPILISLTALEEYHILVMLEFLLSYSSLYVYTGINEEDTACAAFDVLSALGLLNNYCRRALKISEMKLYMFL